MTQEKSVLWYWESWKHETAPTQNCTAGDLAWNYQMRFELAYNSIQETIWSQKARSIRPYTHGGFQKYASRTLKTLLGSHVRLHCWGIHTSCTCLLMVSSASRTRRSLPKTCVIQLRHKPSTNTFHLDDRQLSPIGLKSTLWNQHLSENNHEIVCS